MIKKIFFNFIKVVLIILPIIVFCTDFIKSFWGPIYKLNVNSSNITAIEETLQKDNIEIMKVWIFIIVMVKVNLLIYILLNNIIT